MFRDTSPAAPAHHHLASPLPHAAQRGRKIGARMTMCADLLQHAAARLAVVIHTGLESLDDVELRGCVRLRGEVSVDSATCSRALVMGAKSTASRPHALGGTSIRVGTAATEVDGCEGARLQARSVYIPPIAAVQVTATQTSQPVHRQNIYTQQLYLTAPAPSTQDSASCALHTL